MSMDCRSLWRARLRYWPFKRSINKLYRSGLCGPLPNKTDFDLTDQNPWARFRELIHERRPRKVIEIGTAQAVPGVSTHLMSAFPDVTTRADYTMLDIKPGPDVDIVGDIHSLPTEWTERFDACVACAVFEHLKRPWIAAKEVARILAPGGFCLIGTHQTFPLHGYPSDYFRFSTDALSLIFSDAGLDVVAVGYQHRTKITLPVELLHPDFMENWNRAFPSYALVTLLAAKPLRSA